MTSDQAPRRRWSDWTVEIKVWKILAALIIVPILILWFRIVHQDDEILALIRSEVMADPNGQRTWEGTFVNTNSETLRDVAVIVDLLDSDGDTVARAEAEAPELTNGQLLELEAPLPAEASKLRIYSVQWRMGRRGVLMGPFREPWPFGYLMADPSHFDLQGRRETTGRP